MKIAKIQLTENNFLLKRREKINSTTTNPIPVNIAVRQAAYQDYCVNFRGRTPENFYKQEFNIKFMPETMKEYLNRDYETRKHIPPEQIMSESFKYLNVTDNFSDVKSVYPEEPLFANLHDATTKYRTGILSDIKLARDLSDKPLLKNGDDNLGIYLLRKIYLEGKTIKEINKDFYEKDLNPEYKGIVTQQITRSTTSAFGIRYPKTDFWNSFIATRDEYKKFFVSLPKQSKAELKQELAHTHRKKSPESTDKKQEKSYTRKYTIKKYQKNLLKNDIKKTKNDANAIEKAIRKRFTANDPEASFIVKYLSPIMTIAADKIHLSEEEKFFAESEKSNGKKIENLFAQFWKAKPELLEHYSTAITDTIELFEETYENGGSIPINNEYQIITDNIENKKIIDFIPRRFAELLEHAQTIVPERIKANLDHEKFQQEWEEHFKWRYGKEIISEKSPLKEPVSVEKTTMELLKEKAKENNAGIYHLRGINGEDIVIAANLDETTADYIKRNLFGDPPKYINKVISRTLNSHLMNEDAKLGIATMDIADKLDDDRIIGQVERNCIMKSIMSELKNETYAASVAAMDVFSAKSKAPHAIYRNIIANKETKEEDAGEFGLVRLKYGNNPNVKEELNKLYELYKKPLTTPEVIKITQIMLNFIRNFDADFAKTKESVIYNSTKLINTTIQLKSLLENKESVKNIKQSLNKIISKSNYARFVLNKPVSDAQFRAKCELLLSTIMKDTLR